MHRFEIWAPQGKRVAVRVNGAVYPMKEVGESGWLWAEISDAGMGTEYGYLIDDDQTPYPDPRSQRQPNGVHALSQIYDHSTFEWADKTFQARPFASAVQYEMHIGTFTPQGTLDSAIEKLDYLVALGITHIELMPVASFTGVHGWGYDGVALFSVHEPYGGPDSLKRFVNTAHQKGLAVLLDVVYNHFGPAGNYTGKFGPYITTSHHTPWGGAVNLEESGSHEVRRFFCDNALMWLRDFHIDGLRLDAVHALIDRSAIHFLEQLAVEVDTLSATLGRRFVLIAESDLNDPRIITPREAGGFGIDAQWNDDFHHALFTVLHSGPAGGYYADFGSIIQLAKSIEKGFVYDGIYSKHRNRVHGRSTGNLSLHRFVGFIQNHDQVGNRAKGDRICAAVGFDRAKIAAAIVLLGPSIPMVFQGEEWAASSPFQYFADHEDRELARQVSEGRKREFAAFGWDPDSIPDPEHRQTFLRSKLNWDEVADARHAEMLDWYRELIRLRRTYPGLNDGEPGHTRVFNREDERWLRIERGAVTLICNFGEFTHAFAMTPSGRVVLSSSSDLKASNGELLLSTNSVAVIATTPKNCAR